MSHAINNAVLFNVNQDYPESAGNGASKERARNNIGAASAAALTAETQRATDAEKAAKTEVVAGSGVQVTSENAADGHQIYTVSNSILGDFKPKQNAFDNTFASFATVHRFAQDANGVATLECSYISSASDSTPGLMSTTDKSKLDGIQAGAEVNQNAFSALKVGSTLITADTKTDQLELVAGSNILLTPDAANDKLTISTSGLSQVNADWASNSGPSEILNKPSIPNIKTITTSLPPVETNVSSMSLLTDGRVRVNNSTEIGLLAPTGTQADAGKVLMATYAGSPSKFTATWANLPTPASTYPQIDYMNHTSYYVDFNDANYLYMEDGVCYDIMSNSGGTYTLHLMTNSTTTIHSKIYLWGEQANCMSATIVYEDEAGEVAQLDYTYGGSVQSTMFALDVYARKVHVSSGIAFDTTLCRVYDYPCARRDAYSYNEDLGRVIEYIEPL